MQPATLAGFEEDGMTMKMVMARMAMTWECISCNRCLCWFCNCLTFAGSALSVHLIIIQRHPPLGILTIVIIFMIIHNTPSHHNSCVTQLKF